MTLRSPDDPFLKDAEGASRFVRDLLVQRFKPKWRGVDWSDLIGWTSRWSAHWAMRSKTWKALWD